MPYTGLANQIRTLFHSKAESWIYLANVPVIRKLNNVIRKLNKMSCSFIGLSIHIVVVTLTLSNFMNTSNNYTITDHRDYNIMHNELQTQVILRLKLYYMWHYTFSWYWYDHFLALIPRAYHSSYKSIGIVTQFKIRNGKYMDKWQATLKSV